MHTVFYQGSPMSIANTNLTSVRTIMPKLSQVVPNFARATLRAVAPSIADKRNGPVLPRYSTQDLIDRLIVPVSEDDPDTDAVLEMTEQSEVFIKARDWIGLANYLTEFDQNRCAVPSGERMLEVALYFIRDDLSELYETPNEANYETSFVYSNRLLDTIEAAHLDEPDNYMLAAILARLNLDCAWSARGSIDFADLSYDTKSIIKDHLDTVQRIVTEFDPIAYSSSLLAEVQYSFVALSDRTNLKRLQCAFDDWSELDPANMTPYRHHAFFVPNLHGETDDTLIETEARGAVELGEDVIGSGAYTAMYLQALKYSPSTFTHLDTGKFVSGFDDLMQAMNKDPIRLVHLLEQVVQRFPDAARIDTSEMSRVARVKSARIRAALAPVIRQYIGVLYAVAWDLSETDFLHAIAPSFEEELSRGAIVELTEGGVLVQEARFSS
jgi:hypothetical protein